MIEPVAKCRCGKLFTPMEWAALDLMPPESINRFLARKCPCGLYAVKQVISYDDIQKAYETALGEK